jgi:hypothetical protein
MNSNFMRAAMPTAANASRLLTAMASSTTNAGGIANPLLLAFGYAKLDFGETRYVI